MGRPTCTVMPLADGGTTIQPCARLGAVLMRHSDINMAGVHLMATGPLGSREFGHQIFLKPRRGHGLGRPANFCPLCGTPLTAEGLLRDAQSVAGGTA